MSQIKEDGFIEYTGSIRYIMRNVSKIEGEKKEVKVLQQECKRIIYKGGIVRCINLFWKDVKTFNESEVE